MVNLVTTIFKKIFICLIISEKHKNIWGNIYHENICVAWCKKTLGGIFLLWLIRNPVSSCKTRANRILKKRLKNLAKGLFLSSEKVQLKQPNHFFHSFPIFVCLRFFMLPQTIRKVSIATIKYRLACFFSDRLPLYS